MCMQKKILFNSWFWLFSILTIYTFYDIFEHISRPESVFAKYPMEWATFSLSSQIVLMGILLGSSFLFKKLFQKYDLIFDLAGILIGVLVHIFISGPFLHHWIFPYATLNFVFHPVIPSIVMALYLLIKFLLYLAEKSLEQSPKQNIPKA